jgi:SGNH domain (fused to AT3 domains)
MSRRFANFIAISLVLGSLALAEGAEPLYRSYLREIVRIAKPQSWSWPSLKTAKVEYSVLPTGSPRRLQDRVHVAVIGDSFAHPMAGVFNKIAKERKISVMLSSSATCAPFFDSVSLDTTTTFDNGAKNSHECKTQVRPAMMALLMQSRPRIAVLIGNWVGTYQIWKALQRPNEGKSLQETIKLIRTLGIKVIVIGMVPGSHYDVPVCHARQAAGKGICLGTTPIKNLDSFPHTPESGKQQLNRNKMRTVISNIMKAEVVEHPTQVALVDPYDAMCTETECLTALNGENLYYDNHHLSANGTLLMQPFIEKALAKLDLNLVCEQ